MKIEDLYDAIPNKEDVDVVLINATYSRLLNLKMLVGMMEDEPPYINENSREGNPRRQKNPFWDIFRNEMTGCVQALAELNLTPRTRKALMAKMTTGGIPDLG